MPNWIIQYSFIPTLLVSIYSIFIYKGLGKELKVLTGYIFTSALTEIISRFYWVNSQNNLPLLHIYVVVGFFYLSWFYRSLLKEFISSGLISFIFVAFAFFSILNSIFIQNIYTFNSYALTAQSIIIIVYSISAFRLLMNDIVKNQKFKLITSINWINSGIFIYYTSSLLLNYFGNIVTLFPNSPLIKYIWVIHAFFGIVMYTCFFTRIMETTQGISFLSVLLPLLAIVFIIAIGVSFLNQHFHKNLFRQKIIQEELKGKHQQELLKTSIQAQEKERKRIARDLHDELGAALSIIRMQLVNLENGEHENALGELKKIRSMTENALSSVRSISHELMPPQLERLGLEKTLVPIIDRLNETGEVKVALKYELSAIHLNKEVELAIYRVFMELVQNTVKHANAKMVESALHADANQLIFDYQDDGIGLKNIKNTGLGLRNIDARISSIGGKLDLLESQGFHAKITIPLKED